MHLLLLASSLTDVRPGLIFWTLVTFIILLFVLRRSAWGPILDLVNEREKQIADSIEAAKKARKEAEDLIAKAKAETEDALRNMAKQRSEAQAAMDAFKEQQLAEARKKGEEELANARRQIQEEKAKAIAEVKGVAVDLAIQAAEKLLSEKLDDAKHRQLAEQFIDQLPKSSARA